MQVGSLSDLILTATVWHNVFNKRSTHFLSQFQHKFPCACEEP